MSPSIWQLLIVLAIVLLLFGAKRLRTVGTDLGSAVKGFKKAMHDEEQKAEEEEETPPDRLQGNSGEDADFGSEEQRKEKEARDSRKSEKQS